MAKFSFIWEYRPGRLNVADPLSRLPVKTINLLICCAVGLSAAIDRADSLLADIIAGYAADPFYANASNVAQLCFENGLYYKGLAVAVPDVQSVRDRILQSLHDACYAGHVGGHRTVHNVQRLYW